MSDQCQAISKTTNQPCRAYAWDGWCGVHRPTTIRDEKKHKCQGMTRLGQPCHHELIDPGYCGAHRDQETTATIDAEAKQGIRDLERFLGAVDEELHGDPAAIRALEHEALQDVARLMRAWAARLPDWSDVAARFNRTADRIVPDHEHG